MLTMKMIQTNKTNVKEYLHFWKSVAVSCC